MSACSAVGVMNIRGPPDRAREDDRRRKFNRAENVRQIPPGDPDFETQHERRNDADSTD